jgi:hypothetical protein
LLTLSTNQQPLFLLYLELYLPLGKCLLNLKLSYSTPWAFMMEAWLMIAAGLMAVARTLSKGSKTDYPKLGLNHES